VECCGADSLGAEAGKRRRSRERAVGPGHPQELWECGGPEPPEATDPRSLPAKQGQAAAGGRHGVYRPLNAGKTSLSIGGADYFKTMDISRTTTAIPRFLIRLYQWATMGSARRCRFYPSCSEYMLEALEAKGLRRGLLSGASRLVKCHPWHPGGYDPIIH